MRTSFHKLAIALLTILGVLAAHNVAWADKPPRMAMGLIVKLKDDGAVTSVVRLQASKLPRDTPQHLRLRLSQVAHDRGVSYLVSKPTAFAAQVMHAGHPEPLADVQAKAARLRADPRVEWVLVNEMLRPASTFTGTPVNVNNDPDYGSQIWLQSRDASAGRAAVANFPAAWDLLVGQALTPVVVAVLDTGILAPQDLDGRVWPGYDFVSEVEYARDGSGLDADPSDPGDWLTQPEKDANPQLYGAGCEVHDSTWHGLAVSYMLAAATDNGVGGAGILAPLPNEVLLPVRVAGTCGASVSDMIEGMLWAAGVDYQGSPPRNPHPARVINLSFGGDGSCSDTTVGSASWLYQQTISQLRNVGVLVVASAGNGDASGNGLATVTRPASCAGVLAVTGLTKEGYKAGYANLVEPGKDYAVAVATGDAALDGSGKLTALSSDSISTLHNYGMTTPNPDPINGFHQEGEAGTSFGAPTAVGVAALMLAVNPNLTVTDLLTGLTTQVQPFADATAAGAPPVCTSGVTSNCLPVCDGASASTRGHCYCTALTCGSGVLDAEQAVQWAIQWGIDHPNASPPSPGTATAAYFVPDRLISTQSNQASTGGGGGGAVDLASLLGLLCAVAGAVAVRIKADRP